LQNLKHVKRLQTGQYSNHSLELLVKEIQLTKKKRKIERKKKRFKDKGMLMQFLKQKRKIM